MPTKDIEKQRRYRRAWYYKNKARAILKSQTRRLAFHKWLREFKTTLECEQCHENHPACLEFHHKDASQKDVLISQMTGYSIARIEKEMAKCSVLCSNCHRKLHYRSVV